MSTDAENTAGTYSIAFDVRVFDPEALLKIATAHAQRTTDNPHTTVDSVEDALVMLLDPGDGGAAYTGNLNEAGIEILGSATEKIG